METNFINEIAAGIETEIAALESTLAAPVLDGTPFLLAMPNPDGTRSIYGSWNDLKTGKLVAGWLHEEAVPNHACGAACYYEDHARNAADAVAMTGRRCDLYNIRDFRTNRIAMLRTVLAALPR